MRWQASPVKKLNAALLALGLVIASCGGSTSASGSATPTPSPTFGRGTILIDTGGDTVLLHALFAQTPEQRAYGLMNRPSFPTDDAMMFVFFEPSTLGFYMKDTLIPLSIAFVDVDGKILKILDMKPCPADVSPCPIYSPGVTYMAAIEVNKGTFDRLGVEVGDTVHAVPGGM